MAILLTGGAGFIGSHTAVSLLNAGLEIVIVDNLYNSSPKVIDRIETITGKRPAFVEADCCDKAAMDKVFSDYDITGVIHFAGAQGCRRICPEAAALLPQQSRFHTDRSGGHARA